MSEEKAKSNFENVYLFLGLDDFESDKKRIKQAFENIEQVYGVKLDKLITKNIKLDVPQHIKDTFSQWGDDETQGFIADLANKASIYRLVLADPKKLKIYNEQLRAQPELLQGQSHAQKNDKLVGRQFAPDGEENALAAYYKHLEDSVVSGSNFELKDDADAQKIQQLLNRFMVTYHKYSWDLKHKQQDVQADFDQGDAEIKDVRVVDANAPIAEADAAGESQNVDGEYIEAPPRPEPAPQQKRIGHTVDGESAWVDEPEEEFEAEEDPRASLPEGVDADFEDEQNAARKSFQQSAREQAIYPQGGASSPHFGLPMHLNAAYSDYGNVDLHVMCGIDGVQRSWSGKNGFDIKGGLKVGSYAVNHADKKPDNVALSGSLKLHCNGAFIDGQVDGRIRNAKMVTKVVRGEDGRPVKMPVEESSYKKGAIEIDAGNEDVVINGDMLGKVIIKTTGNVRIIGNVSGRVEIHAGGNIDILGSVDGPSRILAHGQVAIRGEKSWAVKTSADCCVGDDVLSADVLDSIRARISSQEKAERPKHEAPANGAPVL
tara:strand:- start:19378 stop:21015 length:1638 start_codon:yes stop_codon:yes gene_type:complete